MRSFAYARPTSLDEALELLQRPGATPLAGGTDLLSLLKDEIEGHDLLVDLKRVEELRGIRIEGEQLVVGATTSLEALRQSPDVARVAQAVVDAVSEITAPQIRNMGTVAGDLCQRPRCWYYRSGFGLLAERDYTSMPEAGDGRYHAIFGDGPARFASASRLAPALIVLDARVDVAGPGGRRSIAVAELFRSPERADEREITLAAGEVITSVRIPVEAGRVSAGYEVQPRRSLDWPLAAAASAVVVRQGRVESARVAMGHVAAVPRLLAERQTLVVGKEPGEESARATGEAAVADAKPLAGNRYKVQLARVAVQRSLRAAFERAAR